MATLPTHPDLGHLRRQARALQRAAVAGDPQAADRIARNHPNPPTDLSTFRLSAAQLTVAREYGFPSWPRLRHHLDARAAHSWTPHRRGPVGARAVLPARVPDVLGHRRTGPPGRGASAPRARTRTSSTTTSGRPPPRPDRTSSPACSAATRRWPAAAAARTAGGRSPTWPTRGSAAGTPSARARLLLDAGADPDEGYLWHGEPTLFTLLTGVFGEGEGGPVSQPRHPESIALARLLLDRGAEPNDGQTLYNRMFGTDDDHLVLLFEYGLGRGDGGVWRRRLGPEAVDEPQQAGAGPAALGGAARPARPGAAARRPRRGPARALR